MRLNIAANISRIGPYSAFLGLLALIVVGAASFFYLPLFWSHLFKAVLAIGGDTESRCFHDLLRSLVEFVNEPADRTWLSAENMNRCFKDGLGTLSDRSWPSNGKVKFMNARTMCLPGSRLNWATGLSHEEKCQYLDDILACEARTLRTEIPGFLGIPCSSFRAIRQIAKEKAEVWESMPPTCKSMITDQNLCI